MSGKPLYVRIRGKILGPFGLEELRSMRDRGQFRRFHEISEDRRTWASANSLGELFPSEPLAKVVGDGAAPERASVAVSSGDAKGVQDTSAANDWYYVGDDGEQKGPVTKEQLLNLWGQSDLEDSNYVWNPKMTSWQAINSVSELGPRPTRVSK